MNDSNATLAPSDARAVGPPGAPEAEDSVLAEFLLFVREEKRWVVAPMLVTLVCLSALLVFAEGSAIAPFIYAVW